MVRLFNDHFRKQLRFQLKHLFLSYTNKQWHAIDRLLNNYPGTKEQKESIETVIKITDKLTDLEASGIMDKDRLAIRHQVERLLVELCKRTFEIPKEHLWIVSDKVHHVLYITKGYYPYTETELTLGYLDKYHDVYPSERLPFEQQLVEDVTQLSILSFIHPEAVIALEKALDLFDLYYTEVEVSKLFIDDVVYKIKRYLAKARESLNKGLIDRFRNRQVALELNKVEDTTETVESLYRRFLDALNQYQVSGQGLYELLSLYHELQKRPYKEVMYLPGFSRKMALVSEINPFNESK